MKRLQLPAGLQWRESKIQQRLSSTSRRHSGQQFPSAGHSPAASQKTGLPQWLPSSCKTGPNAWGPPRFLATQGILANHTAMRHCAAKGLAANRPAGSRFEQRPRWLHTVPRGGRSGAWPHEPSLRYQLCPKQHSWSAKEATAIPLFPRSRLVLGPLSQRCRRARRIQLWADCLSCTPANKYPPKSSGRIAQSHPATYSTPCGDTEVISVFINPPCTLLDSRRK